MEKESDLLKNKKILIVDDTRDNVFALTAFLESYDVIVDSASSGEAAIEKIKAQLFDVVLMDIRMPGIDGYETISRIRTDADIAKTTVITVTAQAMPGDAEKCRQIGADDYISKPIDTDLLVEKLIKILKK